MSLSDTKFPTGAMLHSTPMGVINISLLLFTCCPFSPNFTRYSITITQAISDVTAPAPTLAWCCYKHSYPNHLFLTVR